MSKKQNSNDPVTRDEFEEGMQMVKSSFDHVATKEDLKNFKEEVISTMATKVELDEFKMTTKEEFAKVHGVLETILSVVQALDVDKKEQRSMADIPERVDHLEEDVLKIKAKVFSEDR